MRYFFIGSSTPENALLSFVALNLCLLALIYFNLRINRDVSFVAKSTRTKSSHKENNLFTLIYFGLIASMFFSLTALPQPKGNFNWVESILLLLFVLIIIPVSMNFYKRMRGLSDRSSSNWFSFIASTIGIVGAIMLLITNGLASLLYLLAAVGI